MLNIGYINKPWENSDFVILAQTPNKNVANCIKDMYNAEYKRIGITTKLIVLDDNELPKEYRFS